MTRPRDPAALVSAARALAALPGIPEAVEEARAACTALRWHPALRRRIPEAAAESRIRGALASAELDGAPYSLRELREHAIGARPWADPLSPVEVVVRSALQATAQAERLGALVQRAPIQAWARLHAAALGGGGGTAEDIGRPRRDGEECRELSDLGPAPSAAQARDRLRAVADLLSSRENLPTLVVAAIAHAEVMSARPFTSGNALVARAFDRVLIRSAGVDPTGVAVVEGGHAAGGTAAYLGALTAYQRGDVAGVRLWTEHCARAVVVAAGQGAAICDAVSAGSLGM